MKKVFEEELYKETSVSDLIVLGIFSLTEKNKKCDFESLAKECFEMFPKAFSFSKLTKWPDARKLDRPLRMLREKKIISGAQDSFFSLSPAGEKIAKDMAKLFRQRKLL